MVGLGKGAGRELNRDSKRTLGGLAVISGSVTGRLIVSSEPLSFWGGYDFNNGKIIDRQHQLSGQVVKDRILVIPGTKGSSTTTAVLLEAVLKGTAPLAIVTLGVDSFLSLALVVAGEMYGKSIPLISLGSEDFISLESDQEVCLEEDGTIILCGSADPIDPGKLD